MKLNLKNSILNCFSTLMVLMMGICPASAQLTADFVMNKPGGCSPVTISFTNTSRGATSNATYYWEFGNGNSSTQRNPSATYIDIKSYQVTLTITDGGRSSSKTMQVVVSRKPVADFEVSAPSGCIPNFNPVFTSKSTTPDGTLSEFVWEWGDGYTNRVTTPATTHTYSAPLKPLVTLTVINSYGCAATVKKQPTEVLPPLTAGFTVDKTLLCTVNESVKFTNTSNGPGNLSYVWNFGDNKAVTSKDVSYTWEKPGEYNVSLTTNNDKGCTNTYYFATRINVETFRLEIAPSADKFCSASGGGFAAFSVNPYPYTTNVQWKFSDESTTRNNTTYVSKSISTAGDYSVNVKALFGGVCPREASKTYKVFASPVMPAFTAVTPKCGSPATVAFEDQSTWAKSWNWTVYTGNNYVYSTEKSHSVTYNMDGNFSASLTATDENGCTASASTNISLRKPQVTIQVVKSTANKGILTSCGAFDATFKATSTIGTIVSWKWDLSEGKTATEAQPSNTFTRGGLHTVSLEYETSDGCTGTATISAFVNTEPIIDVWGPTSVCGNLPVTFNGTKSAHDSVWHYWTITGVNGNTVHYDWGDGRASTNVSFNDTGWYSVRYQMVYYGTSRDNFCNTDITKTNFFRVNPPFPGTISAVNNCAEGRRGEVTFKETSRYGELWEWNFGDGKTATYTKATKKDEVLHTYDNTGRYNVTLKVSAGSCAVTLTGNAIVLLEPDIRFSGATTVCGNKQAFFENKGSEVVTRYEWSFVNSDGNRVTSGGASTNVTFPVLGHYDARLTLVVNNCRFEGEVQPKYIEVLPPYPGTIKGTVTCNAQRGEVLFTENSKKTEKWDWDFGDGKTQSYTSNSIPSEISHAYTVSGSYTTSLTVTTGGCSFTMSTSVSVLLKQHPSLSAPQTIVCADKDLDITLNGFESNPRASYPVASHYSDPQIQYNDNTSFAGLQKSTVNEGPAPYYQRNWTTSYTALLGNLARGKTQIRAITRPYGFSEYAGCPDTSNYISIRVEGPDPGALGATVTCNEQRGEVVFAETSRNGEKWDWDFGDGQTSTYTAANKPARVAHAYKSSGSFEPSVTVTAASCAVTMTRTVSVLLTQKPVLSATQIAVCVDKDLDITLNGFEVNPRASYPAFSWYGDPQMQYDDGSLFTGKQQSTVNEGPAPYYQKNWTTTYTALLGGLSRTKTQIRAIIRPYGFSEYAACPDTSNYIAMRIDGPTADLTILKNNVCYKDSVSFEDKSSTPAGNSIVSREWTFGDGSSETATRSNPLFHTYGNVGSYFGSLKVTDNLGCSDTRSFSAVVAGPRAGFYMSPTTATNKNTVSFTNSSYFLGAGSLEYKWTFSYDGATAAVANPPSRTYPKGGPATDVVTLIATNKTSGCADTVVQRLPVINVNNAFTMSNSFLESGCAPVLVKFRRLSSGFNSFKWDFGDGITLEDPTGGLTEVGHIYEKPGVYKVAVYSASSFTLSKDTTIDSVVIKPFPSAGNVQSNIQETCEALPVSLVATQKDASAFTWDYGDGAVATTPDVKTTYTYNTGGIYIPSVSVRNSDGCAVAAALQYTILVDSLNVMLKPQPPKICDSAVVDFNPVVKSLGAMRLGRPLTYTWNSGFPGSDNTSSAAAPTFFYNKPGTYKASLRVQSPAGCDETATYDMKVIVTPQVTIAAVNEICGGNTVEFYVDATPSAGVTWRWNFDNGQTASVQQPGQILFREPRKYTIKVTADNEGCIRPAEHILQVHSLPVVNPLRDTVVIIGSVVPLRASGSSDIVRWSWSPGNFIDCPSCAVTTSLPRKHMRYEITGINEHGCTASAAMNIRLVCAESPIFVPNTFTPNKDGRNDAFYPRGKGVQIVTFFRVYNRLGEMIFERRNFQLNDPSQGWDGTWLGKPVTSGVFTWTSDMICDAGETFSMKGTLTLLR